MDNIKNDFYYLEKIKKDMLFIVQHTKDLTQEEMEQNEVLLDSILFRLIQISENSIKLTDVFKLNNKEIPWSAIKGLRNRIVHDYGGVDYSIIYETVKNEIPYCLELIDKILEWFSKNKIFLNLKFF